MRHRPSFPRQCLLLMSALALMGLGVALTTRAGLGTSPISAVPYVVTFGVPVSFGVATFLANILLVIGQPLLIGWRNFPPVQYGQLAVVFLFGMFIDAGMWFCSPLVSGVYGIRLLEVTLGSLLLAAGVALEIHADLLFVPGEGFVKALCRRLHAPLAWVKLTFDVSLVILAIGLSIMLLWGHVEGIREGTAISALLVGLSLRWFVPRLRPARKWIMARATR